MILTSLEKSYWEILQMFLNVAKEEFERNWEIIGDVVKCEKNNLVGYITFEDNIFIVIKIKL